VPCFLQACSITPLVRNAEALVRTSRRVLGDGFTFGLMRHTFMKQFCAGRSLQIIGKRLAAVLQAVS
jgi:hypothetical protein